jgi:hypothetical protein
MDLIWWYVYDVSRAGRAVLGAIVTLGVAACAFIVVVAVGEGVDRASLWSAVVAALAGVMAAVAAVWPLAAGSPPGPVPHGLAATAQITDDKTAAMIQGPSPIQLSPLLTEAESNLAIAVRRRAGSRLNEVAGPYSLPVRWANADESLVDHWERIRCCEDGTPLDLAGNLENISDTFCRVPSGRLVVLRRPGAGKSVLALQFVVTLLDAGSWQAGMPVPVVFPLSSWQPKQVPLREWLATTLLSRHPHLRDRYGSSPTLAHALLERGQILPVLDGFDEITPEHRFDALKAIDESFIPGEGYLLTSQPDAYRAATDAAHRVLSAAAVVELADLDDAMVAEYLRRTARKVLTKWEPVLRRLREQPDDPAVTRLHSALATPFMVAMAKATYSDTNADPAALLDATRFPDSRSVEDHLLDALIDVAYERNPDETVSTTGRQRWTAADARDYLGFLAVHQYAVSKQDIQWWMLRWPGFLPTLLSILSALYLAGNLVAFVLVLGMGEGTQAPGARFFLGLLVTLVTYAIAMRFGPALTRDTIRPRERQRRRMQFIGMLVPSVIVGGALGVLLDWVFDYSSMLPGIGVGVFYGAVMAGYGAIFRWPPPQPPVVPKGGLKDPPQPDDFDNPVALLPVARRAAWQRAALATPIDVAGVLMLADLNQFGHDWPWLAAACILTPASAVFMYTVYGTWLATRWQLFLKGFLPADALGFLEDAHARGILRQSGASYQFRHALLQAHLATRKLRDTEFRYPLRRRARRRVYGNLTENLIEAHWVSLAEQMLRQFQSLDGNDPDSFWSLDMRRQLASYPCRTMSATAAEAELRHIIGVLRGWDDELQHRPRWRQLILDSFNFSMLELPDLRKCLFEAWYQLSYLLEADRRLDEAAREYEALLAFQQAVFVNKNAPAMAWTRERLQAVEEKGTAESELWGTMTGRDHYDACCRTVHYYEVEDVQKKVAFCDTLAPVQRLPRLTLDHVWRQI